MSSQPERYRFPAQIKEVAVIGAGLAGITSAAHLLKKGFSVTVFERSSVPGGVWHYDPRVANEPDYPNVRPHAPPGNKPCDEKLQNFEEASLEHAPPGACYKGLRNNIPTTIMRTTLLEWPEGTPEYLTHDEVEKYIQDLAVTTGTQEHILFNTNVQSIRKENASDTGAKWTLRTRTLRRVGESDYDLTDQDWHFDAVIVASGRYHVPKIPDLPGLKEWKERLPGNILHSKGYRSPESFRGKTIFLIGSGVSAMDISRETDGIARKVYQSSRNGNFDLPAAMFSPGVQRVGAVGSVVLGEGSASGDVVLKDGQVIGGVDVIILCTGYITSFPFLGHLQDPLAARDEADENIIITSDGATTHNLHKDMFYIPDPTLIFVGVPYHASAFSLFDFQAEVVARILAGKAELPSQNEMRKEYQKREPGVSAGGPAFHSLMKKDVEYMNGILDWVNRDAARLGHEAMKEVDPVWIDKYFVFIEEMKKYRWPEVREDQEVPLVGEGLKLLSISTVTA